MSSGLDDKELGKRLSAGRGYVRESVSEFAERIKVGRADLADWEKGDFGSSARPNHTDDKRATAIRKVQDASGLPEFFFRIDFKDLGAAVEKWERLDGGDEPPEPGPATDVIPPADR